MTYKQAYDKIIRAYFRDEIKPNSYEFCFCGTLHGNRDWDVDERGSYSIPQYRAMEAALFSSFPETDWRYSMPSLDIPAPEKNIPQYEEKLFLGMSAALDVLKQIHIERGEVIDETPVFTKRQLV